MSVMRKKLYRNSVVYCVIVLLLCCLLGFAGLTGTVWAGEDEAGPEWDPGYLDMAWRGSGLDMICDSDASHNITGLHFTDYRVSKKYRVDQFFFHRNCWCFEITPVNPSQYFPQAPAHEACGEAVPLRIYCADDGRYLGSQNGKYHCRCQSYTSEFRWTGAENLDLKLPADTNVYASVEKARDAANALFPKQSTASGTDGYVYMFSGWDEGVVKDRRIIFSGIWEKAEKDPAKWFTVRYTDGVEDEVVFEDQTFEALKGSSTPGFNGTPAREGFVFKGWSPAAAESVTGDVTYTAVWEEKADGVITSAPSGKTAAPTGAAASAAADTESPETGDSADMILWFIVLLAAVTGLIGAGAYKVRTKEGAE